MKTRNGTQFRIYAEDGQPPFSLHGALLLPEGWIAYEWTREGFVNRDGSPSEYDICDCLQDYLRHAASMARLANLTQQGVN